MLIHGVKDCHIRIEKKLETICLDWLAHKTNQKEVQRMESNASPALLALPRSRRVCSIASCHNVFEVDGIVEETGFDHLPHLSSGSLVTEAGNGKYLYHLYLSLFNIAFNLLCNTNYI